MVYLQRDSEACVQSRLYTLTRAQFLLLVTCYSCLLLLAIIVGLSAPAMYKTHHVVYTKSSDEFTTGNFIVPSPQLSTFNRELWLTVTVRQQKTQDILPLFNTTLSIDIPQDGALVPYMNPTRLSVHLHCSQGVCNELLLTHVSQINFSSYRFTITFNDWDDLLWTKIEFILYYGNDHYTQLELYTKLLFVVENMLLTVFYLATFRRFALRDWSKEQKFTLSLLPVLFLFNNPTYPVRFLVQNPLAHLLDALFQIIFYAVLLIGWPCIFHGLRVVDRGFLKFYGAKCAVVCIPASIILGLWWTRKLNDYTNPTYLATHGMANLQEITIVSIFFLIVYLSLSFYWWFRAFSNCKKIPQLGLRLRTATWLFSVSLVLPLVCSVHLMAQSVKIMFRGLQHGRAIWHQSAWSMSLSHAGLNGLVTLMAVLYSPSKNAHKDTYFKDNPLISMVNDSEDEEDVVYESNLGLLPVKR